MVPVLTSCGDTTPIWTESSISTESRYKIGKCEGHGELPGIQFGKAMNADLGESEIHQERGVP